jgi:hypothetical protein
MAGWVNLNFFLLQMKYHVISFNLSEQFQNRGGPGMAKPPWQDTRGEDYRKVPPFTMIEINLLSIMRS